VTGTIVGFYLPVYFRGLNTAGYHFHFISDDRKIGGHVLDFTLPAGTTVEYDVIPGFTMHLPTKGGFTGADLYQDMSAAIAGVER
jgi:acetolactate decarboxylase